MVKYDPETLRVDEDFFKYGGNISVFENTRLRVEEARDVHVYKNLSESAGSSGAGRVTISS